MLFVARLAFMTIGPLTNTNYDVGVPITIIAPVKLLSGRLLSNCVRYYSTTN